MKSNNFSIIAENDLSKSVSPGFVLDALQRYGMTGAERNYLL